MHNFFTICKLLLKSKIKLKDPNKYKIVVYDDVEIGNFNQILKNYDYFTLKTRVQNIDETYITPNIIKRFIKNFNGNLMTSYLTSLIEVINPKIVITFIDNSFKFSEIAKKLHNSSSREELRKRLFTNHIGKKIILPITNNIYNSILVCI